MLWWFRVLENACRDDEEMPAILGGSIGNLELMKQRVRFSVIINYRGLDSWGLKVQCVCCAEIVELCVLAVQIQERVRAKGREGFNRPKTGSVAAFKVSFRE